MYGPAQTPPVIGSGTNISFGANTIGQYRPLNTCEYFTYSSDGEAVIYISFVTYNRPAGEHTRISIVAVPSAFAESAAHLGQFDWTRTASITHSVGLNVGTRRLTFASSAIATVSIMSSCSPSGNEESSSQKAGSHDAPFGTQISPASSIGCKRPAIFSSLFCRV